MKININLAVVILLISVQAVLAQTKERPDFSGKWELVETNNVKEQNDLRQTLTVKHNGAELRITTKNIQGSREWDDETVYFTDGRGELNAQVNNQEAVSTKTKWDGSSLVSVRTEERAGPNDIKIKIVIKTKRELSKDGTSLIETVTVNDISPPGVTGKLVNTATGNNAPIVRIFRRVD